MRMTIFLILSLILCSCGSVPKLPPGQMFILDRKADNALIYNTPTQDEEKFIYRDTVKFLDPFNRTPKDSLYCITPEFFIDLKNYGKDIKKYIEEKCDK